ncbi:MAG: DMT family transporter [Alphaproteobacteria bacterium]|nr:DMT family transporter [Alphaproteobacteria bacterium]
MTPRTPAAPTGVWQPYLLAVLTVLLFAGHTVVGRAMRDDIPPIALVFWRSMTALAIVTPFVFAELRAQWRPLLRHWPVMVALGLSQAVIGQSLLYSGLHTATAATTGLLHTTMPMLTILIAWVWLRERPARLQLIGVAIASAGVVVIIARGSLENLRNLDFVTGDLMVELAFVSWAVYPIFVTRVPPGANPFAVFWAMTLAGGTMTAPLYVGELVFTDARIVFDATTILTLLYCAVFASILALVCLNVAVARLGPARAQAAFFLMPVFTALLGAALLGETLGLYHVVGMALVVSGVWLTARERARS